MTVSLSNPIDVFANAIAQPLEDAAREWRELAKMHETGNDHLRQQGGALASTLGGDIVQPFTDMISKQYKFTYGITQGINEIAGFYDKGAEIVRDAARIVDSIIGPYFEVIKWVLDRITPDIVVRHGEDAIHAVFDDLRNTLNRMTHDAGSFFGDLFHLNFGAALHDATDEVKAIAHLTGDAIAMLADIEPILCQWATQIMDGVNWCFNEVNSLTLKLEDWVLGISDIASEAAILSDPNALPQEKWLAGGMLVVNVALDVMMFIPGLQEAIFGKIAEKLGIKFLTKWLVTKISESIVGKLIQDFIEKLMTKFAESAVQRALERKLTQTVFKNIEGDITKKLQDAIQLIIEQYLAGSISKAEARAQIDALKALADRFGPDELVALFKRFSAEDLVKIARHNITLDDITKLIADSNKKFPLSDTNTVNALIGPDGTVVDIAGKGTQGADILFRDSSGKVVLSREVKCIVGKSQGSFNDYVLHAGLDQVQAGATKEILIQLPAGTTAEDALSRIARMRGGDQVKRLTADEVSKLQHVNITIVDPSGNVLFSGPVLP
ncbi:MAG TPA: hypothetical protein VKY19_08115 [Ktedonosporobacter sp.]|jgi:histone H3/H4|nr:hypothetical protein [Ktedonosporobacter sp.]